MMARIGALTAILLALPSCDRLKGAVGQTSTDGGAQAPPAAAPTLAFLSGFEGEIDLAITDKETPSPTPLAVFVKDGKVRCDVPEKLSAGMPIAGKAYALLDMGAKKAALVSDAQKEVIVVDLTTMGAKFKGVGAPPAAGANAPATPKTTVTKTGKYDTVAGYKCENWDVASDHREATACVAEEGASWFQLPLTGIPTERLWMAELADGKHFPLRVIGYDKTGTPTGRAEVTKIEKKSLAASDFQYPPAYRVIDLAQLLGGMPAMMGMPGGMPGMPAGMPGAMPGMLPRHH